MDELGCRPLGVGVPEWEQEVPRRISRAAGPPIRTDVPTATDAAACTKRTCSEAKDEKGEQCDEKGSGQGEAVAFPLRRGKEARKVRPGVLTIACGTDCTFGTGHECRAASRSSTGNDRGCSVDS